MSSAFLRAGPIPGTSSSGDDQAVTGGGACADEQEVGRDSAPEPHNEAAENDYGSANSAADMAGLNAVADQGELAARVSECRDSAADGERQVRLYPPGDLLDWFAQQEPCGPQLPLPAGTELDPGLRGVGLLPVVASGSTLTPIGRVLQEPELVHLATQTLMTNRKFR